MAFKKSASKLLVACLEGGPAMGIIIAVAIHVPENCKGLFFLWWFNMINVTEICKMVILFDICEIHTGKLYYDKKKASKMVYKHTSY